MVLLVRSVLNQRNSPSEKRGLSALLAAQFLGAANDNILKTLLSFAVVGGIWKGDLGEGGQGLVALCLFVPFILFSGWAGPLADRMSKRTIAVWMKIAELPLAVTAGIGFIVGDLWITVTAMVLLATQSTFFSPAKYGMIPEIVREDRVSRANGILNMTTNIAVIVGMIVAGMVSDGLAHGENNANGLQSTTSWNMWLPGLVLLSVAVLGIIAIIWLPKLKPADETAQFELNPFKTYVATVAWAWGSPVVTGAIAWSVFYLVATLALLVVTELGEVLDVSDAKVSYLLATIGVAVGIGSLIAGFISRSGIRIGVSRVGAIAMVITLIAAGVTTPTYIWMAVCMFCLGLSAGLYAVPLQSLMQVLPEPDHRGRVLATSNAMSFLLMAAGSFGYWWLRPLFGDQPQRIFVICGFISFVAWLICRRIPSISLQEPHSKHDGPAHV